MQSLGKVVLTARDEYSSTETYNRLDWVTYEGSSFVCMVDGTQGIIPEPGDTWKLLAKRGDSGSGSGDMLQEVYDHNKDGTVDRADAVGNAKTSVLEGLDEDVNGNLTYKDLPIKGGSSIEDITAAEYERRKAAGDLEKDKYYAIVDDTEEGGGGGSVDIDNDTIVKNDAGQIKVANKITDKVSTIGGELIVNENRQDYDSLIRFYCTEEYIPISSSRKFVWTIIEGEYNGYEEVEITSIGGSLYIGTMKQMFYDGFKKFRYNTADNTIVIEDISNEILALTNDISNSSDWLKSKNLIDYDKCIQGYVLGAEGVLSPLPNGYTTDFIKLEQGVQYVASGLSTIIGQVYDENKHWVRDISDYILGPGEVYVRLNSLGGYPNPQLEKGSVATPYQPFNKSNAKLTNEIDNLDNTAKIGMVTYGHWNGGSSTDLRHFKCKLEYAVKGKVIVENNLDKPLGFVKKSNFGEAISVDSHTTQVLNLAEEYVWFSSSVSEDLNEETLKNYLSKIKIYAETGTINGVLTEEISEVTSNYGTGYAAQVFNSNDFNNYTKSGFYRIQMLGDYIHAPKGECLDFGQLIVSRNFDTVMQMYVGLNSNIIAFRCFLIGQENVAWTYK